MDRGLSVRSGHCAAGVATVGTAMSVLSYGLLPPEAALKNSVFIVLVYSVSKDLMDVFSGHHFCPHRRFPVFTAKPVCSAGYTHS